ncbi:17990_t:CDS:10 [Entrophospora sp. SA101]|nr:17990_t:CDS:10 [Entrophospora sp. SA101]
MTENRQQVSDTIGQLIINSLFPEGNESQTSQALLAYIKITEDGTGNTVTSPSVNDPSTGKGIKGEVKIRYLLASIKRSGKLSGKLFLHKSKMNSNDTFSIGRTWTLDNLRAVEIAYKKHFKRLPKLVNIDDTIVPDYKPSSTPSTPSKPQTAPSTPSKTPITPNTPSNEFDNYVAAASLKDRLAHSNKSNSSLKSIGGKNSRSITPSLSMGGGQSDSNSITNQTDEDDEMKQEEISLINVGELLNDFDWKGSGNAEALEERLLNELAALESANIHAMIESDDRIYAVIEQIDYAISELDNMDQWLTLYTDELNSMGDDIHHIEGQNRGLQVQTANQKALLSELDRLLQSITISDKVIKILKHESMDTPQGVQNIEQAATHLKRVLETPFDDATKDMAAVKELMKSYEYHCNNFCSRFYEYMRVMFQYQAETLLNDKSRGPRHNNLTIQSHQALEEHLLKYRGISLWMKQMDPRRHTEIQTLYVLSKEPIYKKETKEYLTTMKQLLFKRELSEEATYALLQNNRTSTNFGNWLSIDNSRAPWEFKDGGGGKLPPEESFDHSLQTIIPLIITEKNFIEDFFHLGTKKPLPKNPLDGDADIEDIKLYKRLFEHMERLYNFMPDELNSFIEYGCKYDKIQVVGMIVSLEKFMYESDKIRQDFVVKMLGHVRIYALGIFEKFINEQLRSIEETKVTSKKRKGIVLFIRIFPVSKIYIFGKEKRSENLEIRQIINRAYEEIVKTMFDCLEAIAKDTESIDKEQLNAHIVTLENMHHFYTEIRTRKIHVLDPFMRYARNSYDKHLEAYAKAVIRRPLLRTTAAPEEVGFRLQYSKAALKKVISQLPGKEIRKSLESLYKRVDKHFTEYDELLQVVWRSIEEEVIRTYERFTLTINKCYPDSNITLEFSMDDLLTYFSDIAKNH